MYLEGTIQRKHRQDKLIFAESLAKNVVRFSYFRMRTKLYRLEGMLLIRCEPGRWQLRKE